MGEYKALQMDEFSWDVLKQYIKHGYGNVKLYHTSFFSSELSDETVLLTLQEVYEKATNHNGELWSTISPLVKDNEEGLKNEN